MATDRQIDANRRNALKSTGPRTEDGKAQSCGNAIKHGMTGLSVEPKTVAAFEGRRAAWAAEYGPKGDDGAWALDRAVAASFQIERCERALDGVIAHLAERAGVAWDLDRALEAATLAAKLADDPMVVSRQLETSQHGCKLMCDLWARLGEAIGAKREWTETQTSIALDLLGIPASLRDGQTRLDPDDGGDIADHRLGVVLEETRRLQRLMTEVLLPLDALDRRQAEAGDIGILSKPAGLVLRYERDAWKRYREAVRALRHPSRGPEEAEASPKAPAFDPEFEPDFEDETEPEQESPPPPARIARPEPRRVAVGSNGLPIDFAAPMFRGAAIDLPADNLSFLASSLEKVDPPTNGVAQAAFRVGRPEAR